MSRYFCISKGLRGCYMPDSVSVVKVGTRRELKSILESEADYIRSESTVGLSRRAIASLAAAAWRDKGRTYLPFVAPYMERGQCAQYPYGLFVGAATRSEYLEHCERED